MNTGIGIVNGQIGIVNTWIGIVNRWFGGHEQAILPGEPGGCLSG